MTIAACLLAAGAALTGTGSAAAASMPQVFTWGSTWNGTTVPISQAVPLAAPAAASVRQLIAGNINGAYVLTDGTVQDWGSSNWGELGDGTVAGTRSVIPPRPCLACPG